MFDYCNRTAHIDVTNAHATYGGQLFLSDIYNVYNPLHLKELFDFQSGNNVL